MISHLSNDFLLCFSKLPKRIQDNARKNYKLWKANPSHPSLEFKRVGRKLNIYSIRIGMGWRALGIVEMDSMIWFWIGTHAEYDKMLKSL